METAKQQGGPPEVDSKDFISGTEEPAATYTGGDTLDAVEYARRKVGVTDFSSGNVESDRSGPGVTASEDAIPESDSAGEKAGTFTSWVKNVAGLGGSKGGDEPSTGIDEGPRPTEVVPAEVRGSIEERAAALVQDLRTPTDLTSNFSSERRTPSIPAVSPPDINSIQRNSADNCVGDAGEQAARMSMFGASEAQDALL